MTYVDRLIKNQKQAFSSLATVSFKCRTRTGRTTTRPATEWQTSLQDQKNV